MRVPQTPKTTIRFDNGLRTDAEQCASERGISLSEFVRQSVCHYIAWCASAKKAENDKEPRD